MMFPSSATGHPGGPMSVDRNCCCRTIRMRGEARPFWMGGRAQLSKVADGPFPCSLQEAGSSLDDDALPDRVQYDFRRVVQIQFLHEIRAVRFDGGHPEIEQRRDLLVGSTFGEQMQNFFF